VTRQDDPMISQYVFHAIAAWFVCNRLRRLSVMPSVEIAYCSTTAM